MKRPTAGILIVMGFLVSIGLVFVGYHSTGFTQNVLVEFAGTAVSFAIGLWLVDVYLQLDEKRKAAVPLLEMITPSIAKWHNDYFIEKGRLAFGIPGWHALLDAYQSNGRNPQALSPEQRDGLYKIIAASRAEVLPLFDTLHDQLKELSALLGWSFNPQIMRAALSCRLNIVRFKNLTLSDDTRSKLDACELYLDIDAYAGAVVSELANLLGLKKSDWSSDTK